jgi:putative phage-type endonuclease
MIVQGSSEWLAERLGKVTASRICDLMARTKSGYSASRANYMAELVCERLTRNPTPFFVNDAMRHGTDQEPFARQAYERAFGVDVLETGFVPHPELDMAGASPDGLIGLDGLLEVKCPNTATHLDTLDGAPIAEKYVLQMQFQMACTGRDWCDFASFDPRLPEPMSLHVRRVPRDVSLILNIETEAAAFLRELDAKVQRLTAQYMQREAA